MMNQQQRPMMKEQLVSCRVDNPAPCEELSLNKWGRDFYSYKHNGAIYQQNGMYQVSPGNGLRVYQQRPFITSEFYNSGCSSLYCDNNDPEYPSKKSCNGPLAQGDAETNKMLDNAFQSTDPFQGNAIPVSACGVKSTSMNASCGWISVKNKDGQERPLWMLEAQAKGEMQSCQGGEKFPHNPGY